MLLREELRRMIEYALWKSEWWLHKRSGNEGIVYEGLSLDGRSVTSELVEGINAYALQQARFQLDRTTSLKAMWSPLIEHAEKVLKRSPDIGTLFIELPEDVESSRKAEEEV